MMRKYHACGQQVERRWCWCLVLTCAAALCPAAARTAELETREFHIFVDNTYAGKYTMTIQDQDHGIVVVAGSADVEVKKLLYKYHYSYSGTEKWQSGRLISLESKSDDDGKMFQVHATAAADQFRVRVLGPSKKPQDSVLRWDVWTTTYWHLPPEKYRNGDVSLVDADTGKPIQARMQYVGLNSLKIKGRPENCRHFHIVGEKLNVDVWYDARERLVREETMEDGHKTILDLAVIRPTR